MEIYANANCSNAVGLHSLEILSLFQVFSLPIKIEASEGFITTFSVYYEGEVSELLHHLFSYKYENSTDSFFHLFYVLLLMNLQVFLCRLKMTSWTFLQYIAGSKMLFIFT